MLRAFIECAARAQARVHQRRRAWVARAPAQVAGPFAAQREFWRAPRVQRARRCRCARARAVTSQPAPAPVGDDAPAAEARPPCLRWDSRLRGQANACQIIRKRVPKAMLTVVRSLGLVRVVPACIELINAREVGVATLTLCTRPSSPRPPLS